MQPLQKALALVWARRGWAVPLGFYNVFVSFVAAVPLSRALALLIDVLQDRGYTHVEETRCVTWEGATEDVDIHLLTRPL